MASVSNDPNGRRRVLFVTPDGKRKSIRLGKVPGRDAERVKTFVEHLVNVQITKQSLDGETARWVAGVGDVLAGKLASVGLINPRAAATLADFIAGYVAGRTDLKPRTVIKFNATREYLIEFFGANRPLREITAGDADDWRVFLIGKSMGENTIRKHVQIAKQFFTSAVRKKLIDENPFADLKSTVQANPERFYFVSREEADKVLAACPDTEWRLIFALSRYGGLRCPSEHLALTWGDVDWEGDKITVRSCKTEHHVGGASRVIPLFPELRPHLEAAWEKAEEGAIYVIARYRNMNTNLRTQLERIIHRAGLVPWPKLFQNLRSTRETELAEQFPMHVICQWIGNSEAVAAKHYLQVTDEHYAKAAQNPAQSVHDSDDYSGQRSRRSSKSSGKSIAVHSGQLVSTCSIAEEGLEPTTRGL